MADKFKTLEEGFVDMMMASFDGLERPGLQQTQDMRGAFYAGALVAYSMTKAGSKKQLKRDIAHFDDVVATPFEPGLIKEFAQ